MDATRIPLACASLNSGTKALDSARIGAILGSVHTKIMIRFLLIVAIMFPISAYATVNPDVDNRADVWCNLHGCGDQPPMDDL